MKYLTFEQRITVYIHIMFMLYLNICHGQINEIILRNKVFDLHKFA